MTRPIFEPTPSRKDASLQYGVDQLFRRPAPAATSGLPFAYAQTGSVATSGALNGSWIADFNGATYKTNSSLMPSIYHDVGNTPEYGIRVPANYLAGVLTWTAIVGAVADGSHDVGWIIDGSYTVTHFGPANSSDANSSAFSATGIADDDTAPEAIYHLAHMGGTADFTVGVIHGWRGWTNDPLNFNYGISVTLLGSLPT